MQPLEIAIKEICKDSVTLIEEDSIHKFLFNNLNRINIQYEQDLWNRQMVRLTRRRYEVINVYPSSGKYHDSDDKVEDSEQDLRLNADNTSSLIFYLNSTLNLYTKSKKKKINK